MLLLLLRLMLFLLLLLNRSSHNRRSRTTSDYCGHIHIPYSSYHCSCTKALATSASIAVAPSCILLLRRSVLDLARRLQRPVFCSSGGGFASYSCNHCSSSNNNDTLTGRRLRGRFGRENQIMNCTICPHKRMKYSRDHVKSVSSMRTPT
jgi:hypothetical protein